MTIPVYNNITTPESLEATIQNDGQVCDWFSLLLNTASVRDMLTAQGGEAQKAYHRFSRLSRFQTGMTGLLGALLLAAWIFPRNYLGGGAALVLSLGLWFVRRQKTAPVQKLSLILIPKDFDRQSLGKQTLYQVTEFYARRHGIPSLVEAINISIQASRETACALLITPVLLVPFSSLSWTRAFLLVLGYPFAWRAVVACRLKKMTVKHTACQTSLSR
ncbi:MAG TPA: hypothetical protein PLT76_09790 [Candidatus Omnitrophota bacterium]|nr:hypothetical protein [Candidatus Omnitrophota bacterium]HQO58993.1 hypothetical protein [Candidatus Omnitrophota bacterium]HQP12056.1 hypothetical protein [Candidatus Omnitrophota bacterium]